MFLGGESGHESRFLGQKAPLLAFPALDTGSAAGRLVLNIMTAVSQWEREAIGERTRDAMSHKRTNGERVGNIQFGYRLGPDGKHVEPAPSEQAVLVEIRSMRQNGHTMRGIAAELNDRALRTRRGSAWRLEHVGANPSTRARPPAKPARPFRQFFPVS
jgi:site-specific DNA recombinase